MSFGGFEFGTKPDFCGRVALVPRHSAPLSAAGLAGAFAIVSGGDV